MIDRLSKNFCEICKEVTVSELIQNGKRSADPVGGGRLKEKDAKNGTRGSKSVENSNGGKESGEHRTAKGVPHVALQADDVTRVAKYKNYAEGSSGSPSPSSEPTVVPVYIVRTACSNNARAPTVMSGHWRGGGVSRKNTTWTDT
jgi:hypothetical protein